MSLKLLKEHLPWVAPSVAIVLAASGAFDRGFFGSSEPEPVAAPVPVAAAAPAPTPVPTPTVAPVVEQVAVAPAPQAVTPQAGTNAQVVDVTRQANPLLSDSGLSNLASLQQQGGTAIVTMQPNVGAGLRAATLEPVSAPVSGNVSSTENAAAFFAAAQANLNAANSCKEDLRALTSQARVYFPRGGLTAEAAGIEQARLIASVAQTCPGVRIQVEGHSDATGDPGVNLTLSQRRAEQVVQRLGASGVDTSNFVIRAFGDRQPSGITGTQSRAYYDRRVEFSVIETTTAPISASFSTGASNFIAPACVNDLENAVARAQLFYGTRSIAAQESELANVLRLAQMAAACPQARLRVVGHHSDIPGGGEDYKTGLLRAKVLMSMLVARGIDSQQIIIAAPSRSMERPGVSGSRVDFDVIREGI